MRKEKAPETYNEAVYQVVHGSGVPIKQLADSLGMADSYLYNCANPNQDEPTLPRKQIIPLTLRTRNFAILDYMEQACGRIAYVVPRVDGKFSDVAHEVCGITKGFGLLLEKVSDALENDGRVDRREFARIRHECLELHRGIERLLAVAELEAKE